MDKSVLIEYEERRVEIQDIRRRILEEQDAIDRLHSEIVSDSVTCGKKGGKPIRTVRIQGIPDQEIEERKKHLKRSKLKLEMAETDLLEMQTRAEEYIESIKRSEMRTMLRYRFIDNMTYVKVALNMNKEFPNRKISYNEENVKKRIQRFFKNVPQCPEETW